MRKNIILLMLCFVNTLISMELSLINYMKSAPNDIKKEIISYINPQEWWYLDASFQHDDIVRSVCFGPTGKLLATGSDDHKARIFDTEHHKELVSFQHNGILNSVCFDPTGKLL